MGESSALNAVMAVVMLALCAYAVAYEHWWAAVWFAGIFLMFCVGEITREIRAGR